LLGENRGFVGFVAKSLEITSLVHRGGNLSELGCKVADTSPLGKRLPPKKTSEP